MTLVSKHCQISYQRLDLKGLFLRTEVFLDMKTGKADFQR